jgi:hypothetical protein
MMDAEPVEMFYYSPSGVHDVVDDRRRQMRQMGKVLTFVLLVLPPPLDLLAVDAPEGRGWIPTPGDIDRTGTFGGGPGSAPGDRLGMGREGPGACILIVEYIPRGTREQTGRSQRASAR